MHNVKFTKLQALGNDFVLIDITNQSLEDFSTKHIQYICDRKYGVGCDQLLIIKYLTSSPIPQFSYKIYNSDGSIAMNCGNGSRSVLKYIHHYYKFDNTYIQLQLPSKEVITGKIQNDQQIEINMGQVQFTPNALKANLIINNYNKYTLNYNEQIIYYAIAAIGNPHAIIVLKDKTLLKTNDYITSLGTFIQAQTNIFSEGVNVNFVYIMHPDLIYLRTFERGSGLTNACGTGAVASATYCHYYQKCSSTINVIMPGGSLTINITSNGSQMIGNAEIVFEGNIVL